MVIARHMNIHSPRQQERIVALIIPRNLKLNLHSPPIDILRIENGDHVKIPPIRKEIATVLHNNLCVSALRLYKIEEGL